MLAKETFIVSKTPVLTPVTFFLEISSSLAVTPVVYEILTTRARAHTHTHTHKETTTKPKNRNAQEQQQRSENYSEGW